MLGVGLFLDRLSPNLPSRQWRMRVSRGYERENDEGGKRNAFTSANRGRAEGDPPPQTLSCAIGARSSGLPARGDFPLRPRPGPRQRVDRARRTRGLHLPLCRLFAAVAEGEGFEPPVPVIPGQRFSRPPHYGRHDLGPRCSDVAPARLDCDQASPDGVRALQTPVGPSGHPTRTWNRQLSDTGSTNQSSALGSAGRANVGHDVRFGHPP
jgi:hypothetical protein